jgi:hypothetical protein
MTFFEWGCKSSQGFFLHVADCTSVSNGEVGVKSGDSVIQFEAGYNELTKKDLGENEKKLLQVEE